ncbi:MAG TPA: UPF0149 family protein [Pseudomonadales bacterium]|nr:UPF0149 family protein [Pseudomonadales bacterium]
MENVLARLDKALLEYSNDEAESVLGVSELDGFLHAMLCAPRPVPAERWLPAIWGGVEFEPPWPDEQMAKTFVKDALALHRSVENALNHNECSPVYLEEDVDGKTRIVVDEWCEGFYLGMLQWGKAADDVPPELLEPILFFVVDLDDAEERYAQRAEMSAEEISDIQNCIPQCVFDIRAHWTAGKKPGKSPYRNKRK